MNIYVLCNFSKNFFVVFSTNNTQFLNGHHADNHNIMTKIIDAAKIRQKNDTNKYHENILGLQTTFSTEIFLIGCICALYVLAYTRFLDK